MDKQKYDLSFRCYFPGVNNVTNHQQTMQLKDIPKWIGAYYFTHPNVQSITVKVWFHDQDEQWTGIE